MEYSLSTSVLVGIPIVALVVFSWVVLFSDSYFRRPGKIPPGSAGLPLIGDTLDFIRALSGDRLKSFWDEKIAKYGSIFKMNLFGGTVVVMDPPAGIKFFFVNENKLFTTYWAAPFARLLGPDSVAVQIGDEHRVCRRHIVGSILGPDTVWRFLPRVEAHALKNLDNWTEGAELCSYDLVKQLTFRLICELTLSLTEMDEFNEALHAFEPWVAGLLQLPINLPGFNYHKALKARGSLHRILDRRIQKRRQALQEGNAPQDWLTTMLTQPDERGHMYTDNEIKDNVQFLLAAGYETSSSVLTLVIRNVAKYPEISKALIDEHMKIAAKKGENDPLTVEDIKSMEYTWRVVQETMRLTPVVNMGMRVATKDFQYNGFTIPKGWKILWSQDRCSREAKFFDNPDEFDPCRFERGNPAPYTYLPFGAGPRACPGNEFAKMEILVFLHHLLKKYKWSLVDPQESMFRKFVPMTQHGSLVKVTRCTKAFSE